MDRYLLLEELLKILIKQLAPFYALVSIVGFPIRCSATYGFSSRRDIALAEAFVRDQAEIRRLDWL